MKLIDKYGLALLQLQAYSDNDLIIVDNQSLSITEELKKVTEAKQNPDITYYLFGAEAVNSYEKGGIKRVIKDDKEYQIGFGTFRFVEGETKSFYLLEAADKWMEYISIPKEDYEKLVNS